MPAFEAAAEYPSWKRLILRDVPALKLRGCTKNLIVRIPDGYLIDLGEEKTGFLNFDFISSIEQKVIISYGEHLTNSRVARKIGERDFSVEYIATTGENFFLNTFRRLAGRYEVRIRDENGRLLFSGAVKAEAEQPSVLFAELPADDAKIFFTEVTVGDRKVSNYRWSYREKISYPVYRDYYPQIAQYLG